MKPQNQRRAALYLRISTDKQETDAQKTECTAYALHENLPIVATEHDTASGALPWRQRKLGAMVDAKPPPSDLIVYEFSRIGRDMVDTLDFLKTCNERGISVHIAKSRTTVRADIGGKVISTVMSLAAEIERDLLRSRTRDALAERKRKIATDGGFVSEAGNYITRLGRPIGSSRPSKIEPHRADIEKMFAAQVADAAIARMFSCDRRTVAKMREAWQINQAATATTHKEPKK